MKIDIPPRLYKKVVEASLNRWSNKKPGQFGKGLINNDIDPCRAERIGLLGEAALAEVIDRKVDYEYKEGGVPHDFRFNNLKLDIKTAGRNYGCGLIRAMSDKGKLIPLKSDVYIFAYLEEENKLNCSACISLVGWTTKEEIEKCQVVPAKIGRHFNYQIPYADLRPIEDLKKYRGEAP